MNIEQFNIDILDYIETNLPIKLNAISATLPVPNKYIEDIPDMAFNKESIVFYMINDDFRFETFTNETNDLVTEIDFYITFQNVKNYNDVNLTKLAQKYALAFYSMVDEDSSFNGIFDYSIIQNIHIYRAAEGFNSAKALKITLSIKKEI